MNNRLLVTICCMTLSLMASAQASGGQIRRGLPNPSKSKVGGSQRPQPRKTYNPVEMETKTYYMCINETWVVKNGQDLCRKMASKGYNTELVIDPDPSMGYHVSVFKTKDKNEAISFYNNFKDDRWGIAYPFYDREYLPNFLSCVNSDENKEEPYSEYKHQGLMKVEVSSARYNDVDITQQSIDAKQNIVIYTISGNDLFLANIMSNRNSQSWGALTITGNHEQPETDKLYRKITLSGNWNYHNTFDDITGTCPVNIETTFAPNGTFTTVTISVSEKYILTYSGNTLFWQINGQ